MLRLA